MMTFWDTAKPLYIHFTPTGETVSSNNCNLVVLWTPAITETKNKWSTKNVVNFKRYDFASGQYSNSYS